MKIRVLLVSLLILLAAKELIAWRMHNFTVECLSEEEVASLRAKEIDKAPYSDQVSFLDKALDCIEEKQTVPEILVFRILGKHLFYAPWR